MSSPIVGDALASLFTPPPPGPAAQVQHRTGVIISFDPSTLANVVMIDGQSYEDLAILNSSEIFVLTPGAVVALLCAKYSDGTSSWAILGRLLRPNTDEAAQVSAFLSSGSIAHGFHGPSESTSAFPWVDLATPGPAVTVNVSSTGRLLVMIGARVATPDDPLALSNGGGLMSFVLSGANTLAADDERSASLITVLESSSELYVLGSIFAAIELTGLNPGETTLTCKYGVDVAAATVFENRSLTVITL